jgi:hypothetical protein
MVIINFSMLIFFWSTRWSEAKFTLTFQMFKLINKLKKNTNMAKIYLTFHRWSFLSMQTS